MRRRAFIATATAATASLAGCSILGGDDGGGGGPEQPIRDAASALEAGDVDAFRATFHPESPDRPGEDEDFGSVEYTDVTVEQIEVVEQQDGNATVEARLSYEAEFTVQGETQTQSQTNDVEYDVRQHEGEWLIYSSQQTEGE